MELTERLKKSPELGKNVFVAKGAHVIGDVKLYDDSSVWFGAVLRGDSDVISVGSRTNIQDNAVLHADPGDPCIIGEDCVIGHSAIVHGARLSHHVLVGMHATVLNNAEIGEYSIIGANALVPSGMKIPPYSLVLGVPAKVVKTLDEYVRQRIQDNVDEYGEIEEFNFAPIGSIVGFLAVAVEKAYPCYYIRG
ncbi:MAG: gamma carbonic anhydrase family protein [Bacteroidetes bacterium]|nr:gamma carbonic anhydrase family protein [Bacteroidota bacterium]